MKSLRIAALILAVGAFPLFSMQAHAQQEVDPDHFDQPSAQISAHGSRAQNSHKAVAAHNRNHGNTKLASKHAAGKGSHHHSHLA